MKILSIDWDYFFPDSIPYDWGAHEAQWLFYELVWHSRCCAVNIFTGAEALEEYVPTIPKNFWNILANKPKMVVSDSHSIMWDYIQDKTTVYSLDAHHDCGYHQKEHVDCSNWGQWGMLTGRIGKMHVIYPSWRQNNEESKPRWKPTSMKYKLPRRQKFDLVFVCRSSCWTPPWFDGMFEDFLDSSGLEIEKLDEIVSNRRNITIETANELRMQFRKMQEQLSF